MKIKLTRKLLGLLYQIVLNEMERIDRKTPVGYVEDLQKLEIILSKYL